MKQNIKLFVLISVMFFAINASSQPSTTSQHACAETSNHASVDFFRVHTADEFLDAIGSNRVIEVASPEIYLCTASPDKQGKYYSIERFNNEISIAGVSNLEIIGVGSSQARLITSSPYAEVLRFEHCSHIVIDNIYLGHEIQVEPHCTAGVVMINDSDNFTIRRSTLYGCGRVGVTADNLTGLIFENSLIEHCTRHIISVHNSGQFRFINADFIGNDCYYYMLEIINSYDIDFQHCFFIDNSGSFLYSANYVFNVSLTDCVFQNNRIENVSYEGKKIDIIQTRPFKKIEDDNRILQLINASMVEPGQSSDLPRPDMVLVKRGMYEMGCTSEQGDDCWDDERPVRRMQVDHFYMGMYEVTLGQFRMFVDDTGYMTDAEKQGASFVFESGVWREKPGLNWRHDGKGNVRHAIQHYYPVLYVSYWDALSYCRWLSRKTGQNYRLPTEAEWEYAARGGHLVSMTTLTKYAGSDVVDDVGWYLSNSEGSVRPVGQKKPNQLGIYDMSGNIWEWCSDAYRLYDDEGHYGQSVSHVGEEQVLRGGSWFNVERSCRVSMRGRRAANYHSNIIGFRVVREL